MKNKIVYIISSFMVMVMMAGCTKYASASPTPETPQLPQQASTIGIPTPTMVAIEVEVATRTPIPLVLKTATPTVSLSDILTATLPVGGAPAGSLNPDFKGTLQPGSPQSTLLPGARGTGQPVPTLGVGTFAAPTTIGFPARAPVFIIVGKPTISIVHVKYADSITVSITNLDPNTELIIRMGSPRSYGTDGTVTETATADATGTINGTYKIPQTFIGYGQIEFRIEFPDGTPYYFPFYNNDY